MVRGRVHGVWPLCHCRKRGVLTTSWTASNPGRRFIGCPQYGKSGACGFFVWYDDEICDRGKQVIPGLLRSKNELEKELRKTKVRVKVVWACLFGSWILFAAVCWKIIN